LGQGRLAEVREDAPRKLPFSSLATTPLEAIFKFLEIATSTLIFFFKTP
jgi:hypothetical protein